MTEEDSGKATSANDQALVKTEPVQAAALDLFVEVGEVVLDAALSDGPIRDIPIIGSIVKLAQAGFAIRDAIFVRKVAGFLSGLKPIQEKERRAFEDELKADPKVRERTGEALVTLLDKLDDLAKAPLLAKLFTARVAGELTESEFRRLALLLDRALVADLTRLQQLVSGNAAALDSAAYDGLEAAGLVVPYHSMLREKRPGELEAKAGSLRLLVTRPAGQLVTILARP